MRYSWRKRVAAAILCGMVAVSSVNTSAFAEVTGADAGAALEELAAAAGALTGGATGEATAVEAADAEKSNEPRQLSFVGAGVRVFKDGVELNSLVEVYEQDEVTLMLVAKQGYALGETATLVTNVEDPIITQFAVEDATVLIPAGTLITDGTLNLTATLTGEPVEEEAAEGETGAESAEAAEDEDLFVSLEDLTNAEVDSTGGESESDSVDEASAMLGGADGLRYTLESATVDSEAISVGNELTAAAEELEAQGAGSTIGVDFVSVEANVENPAFEGYAYVDGAVIKVTAAEGALPAGTRVEAKVVEDEKYAAAVNEAMGDVLGAYVAYDITLYDAQGNEVQPTEPVNVAIFDALTGEGEEGATPAVFHVNDDATEIEVVTARQLDAEVQSFDVEHFSIYLLGYENSTLYVSGGDGSSYANRVIVYTQDKQSKNTTYTLTFACEEEHDHHFWTEGRYFSSATDTNGTSTLNGSPVLSQFEVVKQGELWGKYYCVIKTNDGAVYTGKPQKLYCGSKDNKEACKQLYINCAKNGSTVYNVVYRSVFAMEVETENVKIGATTINSNLASREVAPLFNGLQYSFASLAGKSYFYYFVGPADNHLINYWDSYYILWTNYLDYTLRNVFDYSAFPTITTNGGGTLTSSRGTVSINNDSGTTASDRGYVAYGTGYNYFLGWQQQKYYRIKAKAVLPTEEINANNTLNKNVELKPGDAITFNVTVDPYNLDLTTDQNSSGTVLTKTSTVKVQAEANPAQEDPITTSNEGVARTTKTSDYTTRTIYVSQDTAETHEHSFDYIITRADCVAALKRANEQYPSSDNSGYNTVDTYEVTLKTSVTTDYEAKLKTSGGYLTTTASNTVEVDTTIGIVGKEHYVTYDLTYKNEPAGVDKKDYPEQIKSVEDNNPDDGGKNNKTPFWEGETVSFAGYSVGTIVEDQKSAGYWVFSGWVDNQGNYLTSDIIMGNQDITVTGQWTYVSLEVHYELEESWDYDGTFHPAVKSYVGDEANHVDSAPTGYTFYQQVTGEDGETTWENIGSEQPVNAGTYKVDATWDYIITNPEKIKENEANNGEGSGDAEKNPEVDTVDGDDALEAEGEDGEDTETPETPATKPTNEGTITKTCEFTINKVNVTIESPSASKPYDGYPLTASDLTITGGWIESEAAKISVVATGEQTLPNNGQGEELTPNTIVISPALEEGEETPALALARAKAYASSTSFSAVAEGEDGEEQEPTEEELAFQALLANYNITLKTGMLTVEHRTEGNKLPLTLVGSTPAENLTYNGKDQTVAGYTVNGTASTLTEDNEQTATFDMDKFTGHDQVAGDSDAEGDAAVGSGSGSSGSGSDGTSGSASAAKQAKWTLTGVTATGTGRDASSEAYTVAISTSGVTVEDAEGNNVTSEFSWTTQDGSFTIAPVDITIESDSVSRAYDTTTLTAHSYTITQGSFVRGEGLRDSFIEWGSSQRRVGSTQNKFSIENAWNGTTKQSNYNVTLVYGTLEVLASVDVSERMDITVNANSKQVEEKAGQTQTLTGFTSESGGYVTYTVESGEGTSVLYLEGLSATGSGSTPGKYPVTVSGLDNLRIYDSNAADKIDVTGCFNVTAYDGYLTIRAEGSNAVEFSNRSELQGKTYDGKSLIPVAEGLQAGTSVFYTTEKSVADAAAELPGMTDELGNLLAGKTDNGTVADAITAGWSAKAPEFTDAGTFTVYALGFKDGKFTPVESVNGTINVRKVTIGSESATKAYDGIALTATTMPRPISSSLGWVAADLSKLEITATGSQKAPGSSENTIVIAAAGTAAGTFATQEEADAALQDVLKNYSVSKEPGKLQVTSLEGDARIELAVVGSTGTRLEYDGTYQEVTSFTINGTASTVNEEDGVTSTVLIVKDANEEVTEGTWTVTGVSALGTAKDVKVAPEGWGEGLEEGEEVPAFDATYPVEVTVGDGLTVLDEDGNNVTSQFNVITAPGSFEITKKTVVIASKSASKTYDLQPLTYQYYRITSGGFVDGEGIEEASIDWSGSITSPGSVANTFSLDTAWAEGTLATNYAVTLATGTLTVNHIKNEADKFQVQVKSKSDKQRLDENGSTVTITGFESAITVSGKTYIPVRVTRNGFSATLYVTNLRASASGNQRGTYTNKITGSPVVYDSLDPETRANVAESINVELREGTLRLLGPLDDALVWTNENDVLSLDTETGEVTVSETGIDGTYYDGQVRTPKIESKFYSGTDSDTGLPLTTIYYTTDAEAAKAAENDLGSIITASASAVDSDTAEGDADAAEAKWTTTVPTFKDAGTHTFYAVGVRSTSIDNDTDTDDTDRVYNEKRYTEVETFTLTILKRTVTLSTEGDSKTYDGTAITIPSEVTISEGESGFVDEDAEKLNISVEQEDFILPGSYFATINVVDTTLPTEDEGEDEAEENAAASIATQADDDTEAEPVKSVLDNYQIIKYPGQLDIDTRVGDERFPATLAMPTMTYTWAGSNFYGGKLVAISEYGENKGEEQVVSIKSDTANTTLVKTNAYIELENGTTYELNGFYAQFTIKAAGTYDYSTNTATASTIAGTGNVYQVEKVQNEDGTESWQRIGSGAAVTSSFAPTVTIEPFYVEQGSGNEITSVDSWLDNPDNASSSLYTTALNKWYELNEWSTWTFTGTSATTIPTLTASISVGTVYYSLNATEDGEAEYDENGEVTKEATNTWYTWSEMKDLLVKPGTYTLSFKNTTTSYKDCFAYDALTVNILERTVATEDGQEITVYDPTSSAYGFVWDENGNLLDAADKIVANRDGVPTTGANIEGLPVGPAVIMDPQVTYTGEPQQVKPVVVDDQGRLMVEGIHYTLSYEGDITNVGTAAVRITSIPGSGYNCDFTASFEIVASEYGSLKAAEKYTYVYAGGNDLAEPGIIANYGDSKVIYSLNGEEYESWAEVVEAMVNVGSYTLAIKTDGANYVTSEGTVVVEVQPLDMSATPQESVESVEVEAEDLAVNTVYVAGGDYSYSGEAYEPEVLIIDTYGNQLVYGRDYTTSVVAVEGRSKASARAVDEAINAGSYALAVSYRGNYTGTSYVAFSIDKVAGNEVLSTDASGVDGAAEGHLTEPTVVAKQEGSTFLYSVDGGAFVTWAQAAQQLTQGTHTLVAKAVHTNYLDAEGKTITVTIAARPASDAVADGSTGSTGTAAGTTGSTSTGASASGTSSSSTSGSSAGRTVQAAGTTTSTNAVSTTTETPTTEAVTVENLANNAASSSSASTTPEAQAAVTHATYMYLTITIVTGMLLTAAYSLTVIKQRSDEARRLQARAM